MRAEIVPATPELVAEAAPRLRLYREDAMCARHGYTAESLAQGTMERSTHVWAGLLDGRPVCLFGLRARTIVSDAATPWLLVSPELASHARIFWRHSRTAVAMMLERYPRLVAQCQADFPQSLAWLKRLGFLEMAPAGEFVAFELRRSA